MLPSENNVHGFDSLVVVSSKIISQQYTRGSWREYQINTFAVTNRKIIQQ